MKWPAIEPRPSWAFLRDLSFGPTVGKTELEDTGEMTTMDDLERRVSALETAQKETAKTQTWMASTLGRIASVQDQHTVAIAELQTDMREVKADVKGLKADMREAKADLKGLRTDLPTMLAEAVREGLKQR